MGPVQSSVHLAHIFKLTFKYTFLHLGLDKALEWAMSSYDTGLLTSTLFLAFATRSLMFPSQNMVNYFPAQ